MFSSNVTYPETAHLEEEYLPTYQQSQSRYIPTIISNHPHKNRLCFVLSFCLLILFVGSALAGIFGYRRNY
jgi:hypothetical protein